MSGDKTQTSTTTQGPPSYITPFIQKGLTSAQDAFNASGGSPIPGQAQDYLSTLLSGQFLDPASNPNLQATFDAAAGATQNRLTSEFAGAGRNVGSALPARSQELQGLAASIFGNAYSQERGFQQGGLSLAPSVMGLDSLDLNNFINQTATLSSVAGQQGTQNTTMPSNPFAGALGGAVAGTAIMPGWGTAIGAGIGLLGSL